MQHAASSGSRRGLMLGLLLSATGLAVVVAPAHAALVNPGFEAGLTGWSTDSTNVSTVTSAFGITPPEGTFQALISTEEGSPGASPKITSDIESFLGLAGGSLDSISTNFTTEGSVMKQSFTASNGDSLSFLWNFLTNETPANDLDFNDLAFYTLQTPSSSTPMLFLLADTFSGLGLSSSPFTYETGYTPLSFTLLGGTGTYTIGFGVMHVGDDQVDSGLLVDKLILTTNPVPEPSTVVLLASGLAGLGYWRRKQLLAVKY